MIAKEEYNVNTDNKKICTYLSSLIKLNHVLIKEGKIPYIATLNRVLDYLQKLEHTLEYEDILKEMAYYNLIKEIDQIDKTNIIYDNLLKRMNEHFKCDQIFPEITYNFEHIKEEEEWINKSRDRLIERILTHSR